MKSFYSVIICIQAQFRSNYYVSDPLFFCYASVFCPSSNSPDLFLDLCIPVKYHKQSQFRPFAKALSQTLTLIERADYMD